MDTPSGVLKKSLHPGAHTPSSWPLGRLHIPGDGDGVMSILSRRGGSRPPDTAPDGQTCVRAEPTTFPRRQDRPSLILPHPSASSGQPGTFVLGKRQPLQVEADLQPQNLTTRGFLRLFVSVLLCFAWWA